MATRSLSATGAETQAGMTLIEVMVAMMLVAILLLGMNGLWVTVSQEIDGLVLRQKAIFRLNGEMERLVGLYAVGNTAVLPTGAAQSVDYLSDTPAVQASYIAMTPDVADTGHWVSNPIGGRRLIYPSSVSAAGLTFLVDGAGSGTGEFAEPLAADMETLFDPAFPDNSLDGAYRKVLHWTGATGSLEDDRNLVWLDREKSIVAQISWSVVETSGAYLCYSASPCRHITLYLDYPFRYANSSQPRDEIPGFPVETITLQTIVSRRP